MGSAPHCWAWPSHSEPPPAGPCPLGPASFSGGRPPTPAYSSLLPCCGSLGRAPHPGGGGSPGSSGVSEGLPGRVPCHGPPAWARPLPGRGWGGVGSRSYPARSFSFLSVMPSLDTSLLNTRMPMAMFTCRAEAGVGCLRPAPALAPPCPAVCPRTAGHRSSSLPRGPHTGRAPPGPGSPVGRGGHEEGPGWPRAGSRASGASSYRLCVCREARRAGPEACLPSAPWSAAVCKASFHVSRGQGSEVRLGVG